MLFPRPLTAAITNYTMKTENVYEVIVIGGSYSGLAAGMALGRALRKVLIIDSGDPCNKQTPYSHNFLTSDGKPPKEITRIAKQQVQQYKTVTFLDAFVTAARKTATGFTIQVRTGETYHSGKLVLATGIKDIFPGLPGFAECWGISVLHCPYCHGYEVRQQPTGILANADAAFELATLIANWTKELTLFTNGKANLSDTQIKKLREHRIRIVETEIARLQHKNGYIEHIVFKDGVRAGVKALYARLPFVQHSSLSQSLGCELTPEGYMKTDMAQRTTIPGIYACGDNTTRMRTVANAVAMGTAAGMMLNKEMTEEEF